MKKGRPIEKSLLTTNFRSANISAKRFTGDKFYNMGECSQCGKPAVVSYDDIELCVEHHLMMEQANYLRVSLLAANINYLDQQMWAAMGGLVPLSRLEIPKPPFFIGSNVTLNNINVTKSNVGMINTGTLQNIQNLDNSITLIRSRGEEELAETIKELTEAVVESAEINGSIKDEIAQQLDFLVTTLNVKPEARQLGMVKSIMAGLPTLIGLSASLTTLWDKLEPLLKASFSM